MQLPQPISQLSLVLYKLIYFKLNADPRLQAITIGNFDGYPRISEYIRVLRKKENLEIQTIPIKFTTQFGTASEYASYKLISETEEAKKVYHKIISR